MERSPVQSMEYRFNPINGRDETSKSTFRRFSFRIEQVVVDVRDKSTALARERTAPAYHFKCTCQAITADTTCNARYASPSSSAPGAVAGFRNIVANDGKCQSSYSPNLAQLDRVKVSAQMPLPIESVSVAPRVSI
jgi:hypothetical protein